MTGRTRMKCVQISRTETVPDLSEGASGAINQFCAFLLTNLASMGEGSVFGVWDEASNRGVWKASRQRGLIFQLPNDTTEILSIRHKATFRSVLSKLGRALVDDTYLGGGTFQIRIDNEPQSAKIYAVMFSNLSPTGFGAKLQVYDPTEIT